MLHRAPAFVSRSFLRSVWALEFDAYKASGEDDACLNTLRNWAGRIARGEVADGGALIGTLFTNLWGYEDAGARADGVHSIYPQYPVAGAGPRGRGGSVDAALGWFGVQGVPPAMQVSCEFKPLDTDLDAPQRGRLDSRTPVEQALNYLTCARRGIVGNEEVKPTWAIVTDMNVFRLYLYDRAPAQYLSFNIEQRSLYQDAGLLGTDGDSQFERYLFKRLFHAETLLTRSGKPLLEQLIGRAWIRARDLEKTFYTEYRDFRQHLYTALLEANPNFPGTRGRLVRLAQKLLDRAIFIFYCEDMGRAIAYPPQLLRDFLINRSRDPYLSQDGNEIWVTLCGLFRAMNEGTVFGDHRLNQFNGGLFANDPELEGLNVPNYIFCIRGQGHNEASLYQNKLTLLYLSASYNYAADLAQGLGATRPDAAEPGTAEAAANARKSDPETALGLYTLGHIFEQSITELEILEAEADGRISVNKESGRKTNGVYYTPEWIVERIVQEALGGRLTEVKQECGWTVDEYGTATTSDVAAIDAYRERLQVVRVLDPACGSGAFLITALKYLMTEWRSIADLRRRVTGDAMAHDEDEVIRDVLRTNLYGVDINPSSVEITRLAMWLHTARGDRPLSSLHAHIRDGNSLIDGHFWLGQQALQLDDEGRERINTFDWAEAFPEAMGEGGFDVVLGNPPYVKLQNFRRAHPDMADYLRNGRPGTAFTGYHSAQSGNFDLYLPFIEKGVSLLRPGGRLGYIAPSVWVMNEYGKNLRELIAGQRSLSRWLDFRSHQIFEEATVYTALQFFRRPAERERPENVEVAAAPDGIVADNPWQGDDACLPYNNLNYGERWLLMSGAERALIDALDTRCDQLGSAAVSEAVFVGLQTSADSIYHLRRIAPGRYASRASGDAEVRIEDAVMRPLVSGPEVKRYLEPDTDTYILFPYQRVGPAVRLLGPERLEGAYPAAWAYLKSHEAALRGREGGTFDDDQWYRFGRHQNLDKQDIEKLVVAQTVPGMRVCLDSSAEKYLNNVRVNGILPADGIDIGYLLAVLNGPVCDWVFRRIAKPKDNQYFEANRQFIAPLPVPRTDEASRSEIATTARELQRLHSSRRDIMRDLRHRLNASPTHNRRLDFIFPTLRTARQRRGEAPRGVDVGRWATAAYELELAERYGTIASALHPEAELEASFERGELRVLADGATIIDGIFVDASEGPFIAAQWNARLGSFSPPTNNPGRSLVNLFRRLIVTDNQALRHQVIALEQEQRALKLTITANETTLHERLYALYGLNDAERRMIEQG
jgi:type I restriction-modification system DNA methylase subunit